MPPIRLSDLEAEAPQNTNSQESVEGEAARPAGPVRLSDLESGKKTVFLKDQNTIVEAPPETSDEDLGDFIEREIYGKQGGRLLGTLKAVTGGPAVIAGELAMTEPVQKAGWNALKGAGAFFSSLPGVAGSLLQEEGERMGEGPTLQQYFGGPVAAIFDPNLKPIDRILLSKALDPVAGGVANAWLQHRVLKRQLADRSNIDERLTALGQEIQASNRAWIEKNGIKADPGYGVAFDIGGAGATVLTSLGIGYATRNPALVGALFGTIQKGQLYAEARAAGKSPEEAGNLSTLGGVAEGALEGLGLEIFMNTLRGSKTVTRILLRSGEEAIQEGLQQTSEEVVAKLGWDREGTTQDIAKRIGYSAMIGFVVGAPAAVTATALENKGIIGELRQAGMTDKEAHQFLTTVTEKITAAAAEGVVHEVRLDVSEEYQAEVAAEIREEQADQAIIDAGIVAGVEPEIDLTPQQQGMKDAAIKLAKEQGVEITPSGNLILYHGTRTGQAPREGEDFRIGTYFTPDIKIAQRYADQAQGEGQAVVMRYEIPPHTIFASGGIEPYYTLNENVKVKSAEEAIEPDAPMPAKAEETPIFDEAAPEGSDETISKDEEAFLSFIQKTDDDYLEDAIFGPREEAAPAPEGELSPEEEQQARDLMEAENDVISFMAKKEFVETVGKFKRFKDNYLKEELSTISRMFFTTKASAQTLDEVADRLGVSMNELIGQLQDISRSWKKDLAAFRAGRATLLAYHRDNIKIQRALNKKVMELKKHLRSKPALNYKGLVRKLTGQGFRKTGEMLYESQALRAVMQAQVRAALTAEKVTKQNLRDLKRGLVETIKEHVPPAGQRRFLALIANAENGADILRAVQRIDKVAEELHRKDLVADIKKTLVKIEESKSIAIDYVQKIRELVDGLDLTRRTGQTLQRLVEIQKFIERKRAAGEDVSMPQAILDKLEILSSRPLNEIPTQTLENILRDMAVLIEAGKKKLETFQAIEELRKSNALAEIGQKSKKLDEKDIIQAKPGEKLSRDQVMKNKAAQIMNWAMRLDLSITPMDVVFDTLDGVAGYQGANFRIFKKTVDEAYSKYIQKKHAIADEITTLAEDLKLEDTDFEKIGFYAAAQQEGGAQKLESLGFTAQEIEAIKLTPEQKNLYDAMRAKLDGLRPEIANVMRVVYNEELGEVKNYFPFMTDFEAMSDAEIRERFGDNVEEFGQAPKKNVQKGFTKKRVGGAQKIKLNAMEIFLGHIDNAAYLLTVGKETKRLGEIAASPKYAEAVGELGQEVVRDWIDIVARKGKAQGQRDNILDVMRRHTGAATLGFKLSSTIIQPTALFDGAALIGGKAFEGAALITKKEWREFILNNMPEVKERIGDDVAFTEFGSKGAIDKVQRAGFWALQQLDALTASSIAAGAYVKYLEDNKIELDLTKPNAEAVSYAQKIVRRTQASSFFKDAPSALTRGTVTGSKSMDRAMFQFQTFMLNRWSLIKHDLYKAGIKGDNKAQAVNIASWLMLAAVAETGLRRLSKEFIGAITGDDDDKKDEDGFGEQVVKSLLSNIPFVSSLISFSQYGSIPIPTLAMMQRIGKRAEAMARSKKKKTVQKNTARFWLSLAGWLFGIPGTVQADDLIRKSVR
jgi:hypothetical protein